MTSTRATPSSAAAGRAGRRSVLSWLRDRSVATKVVTAVGVPAAAMLVLGGAALWGLRSTQQTVRSLDEDSITPLTLLSGAEVDFMQERVALRDVVLAEDETGRDGAVATAVALDDDIDTALSDFLPTAARPELVWAVQSDLATWRTLRGSAVVAPAGAGDVETARDNLRTRLAPASRSVDDGFGALMDAEVADSARQVAAADARTHDVLVAMVVTALVALLAAALVAAAVALSVRTALGRVRTVLAAMERGDLTRRVRLGRGDDIGQMADGLDAAQDGVAALVRDVSAGATTLAAAAEQLSTTSQTIAASAEETAVQSAVVAAAADQVSRNVRTVATGAEEMGASIREISQNAYGAAEVASQAVLVAHSTSDLVARLGASSQEIGKVVRVITTIAEQTNLLALNATIEAARAGEAGRGFAVVASEVKDLAQETGRATGDISARVAAIQSDTEAAVAAIAEIGTVIDQVNGFQGTIASAVEEQTATTGEMTRNVSEAAAGAGEIAGNITGVAAAASATTSGIGESLSATRELSELSTRLQDLVRRFTV